MNERDNKPDSTAEAIRAELDRVPQRVYRRDIDYRENSAALEREGCICGEYAAVTGQLHPDCPKHGSKG